MIVACHDCGLVQELPPLQPRMKAFCPRCERTLERTTGRSLTAAFALAFTTFLLLIPAYVSPFMSFFKYGFTADSRLDSGVGVLYDQNQLLLASGILVVAVALPLVRFGLLAVTLGALRFGRRYDWMPQTFRWANAIGIWAVPEVLLLAAFVGYNRLAPYVRVHLHAGAYCFLAAAFFAMLTPAVLDRRAVWNMIGRGTETPPHGPYVSCTLCDLLLPASYDKGRCPRCHAPVHARKCDSLTRTAAFLLAGYVLYFPANIYPITVMTELGKPHAHTIFWGIERLVQANLLPLAGIVFCTSILIPLLKMVGLTWCLISVHRKSPRRLVAKTKLHRLIYVIGRWSYMDPLAIVIFAPLIQFGQLISVNAGIGATFFFAVVALAMLASESFDPRLMWDAAEAGQ